MSSVNLSTTVLGATTSWEANVFGKAAVSAGSAEQTQPSAEATGDILSISNEGAESADSLVDASQRPGTSRSGSCTLVTNEGSTYVAPESSHKDLVGWLFGLGDLSNASQEVRLRALSLAVQTEAERLDRRVATILSDWGIELGEDQTLELKVDAKTKRIVVSGIADEKKAAAIEEALNDDESLANELLVQYARKNLCDRELASGSASPLREVDSRVWGILYDSLLRQQTGASLQDIRLDDGSLVTDNPSLANLLGNESLLSSGIEDVLAAGNQEPLEVSFALKNGVLIDKESLGDEELGCRVDDYQKAIEPIWREYCVDPVTRVGPPSIGAFRITIGRYGQVRQIDSVPGEPLTSEDKDLIGSWFNGRWAKKISPMRAQIFKEENALLSPQEVEEKREKTLESQKKATAVNAVRRDTVVQDILRRHQFDDGDTDQYEHEVRFTFNYHGESSYAVLSEEADAVLQKQIAGMIPEVTQGLEEYFQGKGIDMSNALQIRFDENGRLACDVADGGLRDEVQSAVDDLNQALDSGQAASLLGTTFDRLLEIKALLAEMHDPDTNLCGFAVGG